METLKTPKSVRKITILTPEQRIECMNKKAAMRAQQQANEAFNISDDEVVKRFLQSIEQGHVKSKVAIQSAKRWRSSFEDSQRVRKRTRRQEPTMSLGEEKSTKGLDASTLDDWAKETSLPSSTPTSLPSAPTSELVQRARQWWTNDCHEREHQQRVNDDYQTTTLSSSIDDLWKQEEIRG